MNVARAKASRHRAVSPWLFVFILHRQICHSFRIPLQGQFFPLICYPPPLDKNESCQAQDTGFELEMPFGTRSLASAKSPQLLRHKDDEQTGTGPLRRWSASTGSVSTGPIGSLLSRLQFSCPCEEQPWARKNENVQSFRQYRQKVKWESSHSQGTVREGIPVSGVCAPFVSHGHALHPCLLEPESRYLNLFVTLPLSIVFIVSPLLAC